MGNTHTVAQIMQMSGRTKEDSLRVHFKRKAKERPDIFPDNSWREDLTFSPEQAQVLCEKKKRGKKRKNDHAPIARSESRASKEMPGTSTAAAGTTTPRRSWVLFALMIAPTVASVENMFQVTRQLSESDHSAAALTIVLSVSALGFVWAGIRAWWSVALAVMLIAFESFCNLARIYGGLMQIGKSENPTRFLGLVTDIFNSGSHGTAIILGAAVAVFIAAVQYAAIFELNRK